MSNVDGIWDQNVVKRVVITITVDYIPDEVPKDMIETDDDIK